MTGKIGSPVTIRQPQVHSLRREDEALEVLARLPPVVPCPQSPQMSEIRAFAGFRSYVIDFEVGLSFGDDEGLRGTRA